MATKNLEQNIQEWIDLNNKGSFIEARDLYFSKIFYDIIDRFTKNTKKGIQCDVLFSILGYTPEPIILTQRALSPSTHVIFTSNKDFDKNQEIVSYLEKYLTSDYKIIILKDETFECIYKSLKAQMNLYTAQNYVIDITGGKKSMVAAASIFAKDYNCNVVYVDYDEYFPELRRPKPGTEKLNLVYSVKDNILSTLDFNKTAINSNEETKEDLNNFVHTIIDKTKIERKHIEPPVSKQQLENRLKDIDQLYPEFKNLFEKYSSSIEKYDVILESKNIKSIDIFSPLSEKTYKIERAPLWAFYVDCIKGNTNPRKFLTHNIDYTVNNAIYKLLCKINNELLGYKDL